LQLWMDSGEDIIPCEVLFEGDPLTAIARIYAPCGFVVATDGLDYDHQTKSPSTDEAQKIFYLHHDSADVICSMAGYVRWRDINTGTEIVRASKTTSNIRIKNADDYADLLRSEMQKSIDIAGYPLTRAGSTETYIFLDGYVLGAPMRRKIILRHEKNKTTSECSAHDLVSGKLQMRGEQAVYDSLRLESPDLAASTIPEMITLCDLFIRSHYDQPNDYGGRIGMATLTPPGKFQWVPGFKPVEDSLP
jgi:hypothetical protein